MVSAAHVQLGCFKFRCACENCFCHNSQQKNKTTTNLVIWVSTQLGGARLLGEPHCSAPVRSLLQRTLLRGETTALR